MESADEMGEMTLQLLPDRRENWPVLAADYSRHYLVVSREHFRLRTIENPKDAEAHGRLGRILAYENQNDEAIRHLSEAIRLDPRVDGAHFDLGSVYLRQNQLTNAYEAFRAAARLNPEDGEAFGSLGVIAERLGNLRVARAFFERALQINPGDTLARGRLDAIRGTAR